MGRIYVDRVVGRDCDHRHFDCTAVAGRATGARGGFKIRDITDGTSNTLAIGEFSYFTIDDGEPKDFPTWVGMIGEDEQILFKTEPSDVINSNASDESAFSFHTGGAQFTFCDGSVHFISENIDTDVYFNLRAKSDGKVVGEF